MSIEKKEVGMKVFRVLVWLIPIVFGAGIAYSALKDVPENTKRSIDNVRRVSLVEKDITYIREGIDDIKDVLKGRSHGRNR